MGCGGGDDESAAKQNQVDVSAAEEPVDVFIERLAKTIETATARKDCAGLEAINGRSLTRFSCPAEKSFRKSMGRFKVVGAEVYGTGAIVDYKSGAIRDGAAIVLFVSPDRGWGVSRFGVVTKPSTETSDDKSREGYAKTLDEYLTAVSERDCDAYVAITFNGDAKKDVVCRDTFPDTKALAKLLEDNPNARPRYEGGNETYGFYSLETAKPRPANFTISIAKSDVKGPQPYVVLDIAPSPTTAQQKQARQEFDKAQKQKQRQDTTPSSKPLDN